MSARLTISSGLGPVEVRVFVARLADAIEAIARERGVLVTHRVIHGGAAEPSSVDLAIDHGSGALMDLVGTHALVAKSDRRSKRDRKRWYVAVSMAETPRVVPIPIDPHDVTIDACRASGAGGQHVQKTASAVRATHRPTGIAIRVEDERSQHRNRSVALARLAEALGERGRRALADEVSTRRAVCLQVERGRPVRVWRLHGEGIRDAGAGAT